jgi:hypothetical protein
MKTSQKPPQVDPVNVGSKTIRVTRSELSSKMKSKLDVYNILANEGQLYLPPYDYCTMEFIQAIFM